MCGRYTLSISEKLLKDHFNAKLTESFKPRFNAAPSQNLPVVTNLDPGQIQFFQWGLVPFWAKDEMIGSKLINARSETLLEKPSFRDSARKRRCLIPADGFYEWKRSGQTKTPFRIHLKDRSVYSMAGLWDSWEISDKHYLNSFTVITTEANEKVGEIYDRMPVILPKDAEQAWLSNDLDQDNIESLLMSYPAEEMDYYAVSTELNRVENDFPELIIPSGHEKPGQSLPLFQ